MTPQSGVSHLLQAAPHKAGLWGIKQGSSAEKEPPWAMPSQHVGGLAVQKGI